MAKERKSEDELSGRDDLNQRGRIKNTPVLIYLFICLLLFSTATISATLKGRISSDLYGYTVGDQDHLQSYFALRAYSQLWSDKSKRHISFHTYSRWATDLIDKQRRDPEFSVYSAYLRFEQLIPRSRIQLGRQFAYSSTGSALIDGARITLTPTAKSEIDLFGGSSVTRVDPERVTSFSDEGILGARVSYLLGSQIKPSLQWFYRKYNGKIERNRVGFDLSARLNEFQFYTRSNYDIETLRLAEYMARLAYSDRTWYAAAEWLSRDPSVPAHSIYSLIDYERFRQTRFELRRQVTSKVWLVSNLTLMLHETEENVTSLRVGLQSNLFSIGWNHQNGYAGERDGLYGNIYYKLSRAFTLYGRADLSRYQIQSEFDDRSDAYSAAAGLQWRHNLYEVRIEGQYLRNATATDDSRIRFTLSRGFSFGEQR